MKPGTLAICSGCRHQARGLADQGHPNPCGRQFWDGPQLHRPTIDGGTCAEFEAEPAPPTGPPGDFGLGTASVLLDDKTESFLRR